MRELQCKAGRLKDSILGKITRCPKFFKRSDYILIAPHATKGKHGYAATIALASEEDAPPAKKLQPESPLPHASAQANDIAPLPLTEAKTTEATLTTPAPTSATAVSPSESCPLVRCDAATL